MNKYTILLIATLAIGAQSAMQSVPIDLSAAGTPYTNMKAGVDA